MFFVLILLGVSVILLALVLKYRAMYNKERKRKSSISVRHGKFIEHYIPWIKKIFPYDPKKFRFLGNPIDGILFGDDKIYFMEFKTGKSGLNKKQRKIKKLIKNKKVGWKEIKTG